MPFVQYNLYSFLYRYIAGRPQSQISLSLLHQGNNGHGSQKESQKEADLIPPSAIPSFENLNGSLVHLITISQQDEATLPLMRPVSSDRQITDRFFHGHFQYLVSIKSFLP